MKHQDMASRVGSHAGDLDEIPRTGGRASRVRDLGQPLRDLFVAYCWSVQPESGGAA